MIKILKMDKFRREDILPEPPEQAEISNSVKKVLAWETKKKCAPSKRASRRLRNIV